MSTEWVVALIALACAMALLGWCQLRDASARYRWIGTAQQPRRARLRGVSKDSDDETPQQGTDVGA